jgi:hypothetical protein
MRAIQNQHKAALAKKDFIIKQKDSALAQKDFIIEQLQAEILKLQESSDKKTD